MPTFLRAKPPNYPSTVRHGHLNSPNAVRHSPSPANNPSSSIYTSPNSSFNQQFRKLKLMISPQRKQPLPTDRSPDESYNTSRGERSRLAPALEERKDWKNGLLRNEAKLPVGFNPMSLRNRNGAELNGLPSKIKLAKSLEQSDVSREQRQPIFLNNPYARKEPTRQERRDFKGRSGAEGESQNKNININLSLNIVDEKERRRNG